MNRHQRQCQYKLIYWYFGSHNFNQTNCIWQFSDASMENFNEMLNFWEFSGVQVINNEVAVVNQTYYELIRINIVQLGTIVNDWNTLTTESCRSSTQHYKMKFTIVFLLCVLLNSSLVTQLIRTHLSKMIDYVFILGTASWFRWHRGQGC